MLFVYAINVVKASLRVDFVLVKVAMYACVSGPVCENGAAPSLCWDSCSQQTCSFFQEAVCKADVCNNCTVDFFTPDTDRKVDCNQCKLVRV